LPDYREEIRTTGSSLKEGQVIRKHQGEILSLFWMSEIRDIIQSLYTGQRKGELHKKTKETYLRDVSRISKESSVAKRIAKGVGLINSILADIAAAEVDWRPRGKLIESGRFLEGRDEIRKILSHDPLKEILICDPWCSEKTIKLLESAPLSTSIRILTVNVKNREELLLALLETRRTGRQTALVILDRKGGSVPHDRFIVVGDKAYQIGCSLDQVGMKDTMIVELDNPHEVKNMILDYIEGRRGKVFERQ
jgi:hypothetical protein